MQNKTFLVPNIGCMGCVNAIESELKTLSGVQKAKAEVTTKMVTVEFDDPTTWDDIVSTLTEIEYAPAEA